MVEQLKAAFTAKIPERKSDRRPWQLGLKALLIVTALFVGAAWLQLPGDSWRVGTGGPKVSPYNEQDDPRGLRDRFRSGTSNCRPRHCNRP